MVTSVDLFADPQVIVNSVVWLIGPTGRGAVLPLVPEDMLPSCGTEGTLDKVQDAGKLLPTHVRLALDPFWTRVAAGEKDVSVVLLITFNVPPPASH